MSRSVSRRSRPVGRVARGGLRAWARRHAYSLLSSLGTLVRHPVASAMTIVVLAVALSLPTGLWVTLDNAARISQGWEQLDTLSVFLNADMGEQDAMQMASRLSAWPEVVAVDPISPEAGLAELGGQMNLGDMTDVIEDNPLPWVLEITPASGIELPELADRLRSQADTDRVVIDLQWLERLEAMVELIRMLTVLLAVLFAAAVIFIVGNTIRMDIQNRREEIEVLALVGATTGFIRRPFLYSGLWYGLSAGVLAWLLVFLGLVVLSAPVSALSGAYDSQFGLQAPPLGIVLALLGGSGFLGVAGSWLAVSRHLRRIHP